MNFKLGGLGIFILHKQTNKVFYVSVEEKGKYCGIYYNL